MPEGSPRRKPDAADLLKAKVERGEERVDPEAAREIAAEAEEQYGDAFKKKQS